MISDGFFVIDDQIKLGDFLDRYMQDVAIHDLRPGTFQRHSDLINNHIIPELGNIKLAVLRPDQVQACYTKKLNEGLSKRTVLYIQAVLHKGLK